jgi:hypothetical protein
MTKDCKIAALVSAEDRAIEALLEADPATPDFNYILNNIGLCRQIRETVTYSSLDDEPDGEQLNQAPAEPEPAGEADIPQVPWNPETAEAAALDRETVKKKLIELSTKGVKLDKIFEQMGCANLSAVPAERYPELLYLAEREVG